MKDIYVVAWKCDQQRGFDLFYIEVAAVAYFLDQLNSAYFSEEETNHDCRLYKKEFPAYDHDLICNGVESNFDTWFDQATIKWVIGKDQSNTISSGEFVSRWLLPDVNDLLVE